MHFRPCTHLEESLEGELLVMIIVFVDSLPLDLPHFSFPICRVDITASFGARFLFRLNFLLSGKALDWKDSES